MEFPGKWSGDESALERVDISPARLTPQTFTRAGDDPWHTQLVGPLGNEQRSVGWSLKLDKHCHAAAVRSFAQEVSMLPRDFWGGYYSKSRKAQSLGGDLR
jgi:hypothetical protein